MSKRKRTGKKSFTKYKKKRKSTYKKKTRKARKGKKSFAGKARGYTSIKWPTIDKLPDHAFRKHVTIFNDPMIYTYGGGGGSPFVATVGDICPKDYFYIDANNPVSPGIQNGFTGATGGITGGYPTAIPRASGMLQMRDLYKRWQVVGCKCTATASFDTSGDGGGVGLGPRMQLGIGCVSSANNTALQAAGVTNTPSWADWDYQKYFKRKYVTFGRDHAIVESATVSMYVRPEEIEGFTSATYKYVDAGHWGNGDTLPTIKPTFYIMLFGLTPGGALMQYQMSYHITWYVEWAGTLFVPNRATGYFLPAPILPPGLDRDSEETKKEEEDELKRSLESEPNIDPNMVCSSLT